MAAKSTRATLNHFIARYCIAILIFSGIVLAQNSARMLSGVNAQTGTTYTFTAADSTRLVTFSNTSPVAASLPSGITANFGAGALFSVKNLGAGTVTITCASCLISSSGAPATTLVLTTGQGADIYSDGVNYSTQNGSGSGGGGGGGNVSTTPGAGLSQDIVQLDGTHACINIDKSINVCPSWNWTPQTPSGSLTAASPAVVTLTPCVQGWSSAIFPSFNGYMHLDTVGTPEEVLITSATDCSAGSQTVGFTPANNHANGYTIRSSTQGWQEAWNAARFKPPGGALFNQGGAIRAQSGVNYTWTGPLVIGPGAVTLGANGTVDFTNSIIRCNVGNTSCLQIGDITNAHPEVMGQVQVLNFRGEPFVVNGTTCMIEDNGEGTKFDGIYARSPSTAGATFGYYLCGDDDQAMEAFHISTLPALTGIRCDATFCGAVVLGGHGSAPNGTVIWIHDSELSMQCRGNGILDPGANTLRVSNTILQGYSQFGVSYTGGTGDVVLDDVYMESTGCPNPMLNNLSAEIGLLVSSEPTEAAATIHGGEGPAGTLPQFANTGATAYFYYAVFDDGAGHLSTPLLAGTALSNGSGSISVQFYKPVSATNVSILRVSTTAANLFGTGNFLVGTASQSLGSVCSGNLCTITDTNAALNSYTVPSGNFRSSTKISYYPAILFWPGDIGVTIQNDSINSSVSPMEGVVMDFLLTGGSNAGLWSVFGTQQPSFYAHHCGPGYANYSPVFVSCLAAGPTHATTTWTGISSGLATSNHKGRYNMGPGAGDIPQHTFTVVDASWDKTMALSGNRPLADAADSWIGYDQVSGFSGGLAFGAGGSSCINDYINNIGDGTSFLEQLCGSLKTFKVPVTTNSQVTSTLATGTAPLVITSTTPVANLTVSNHSIFQDCGATTTCANTQKTGTFLVMGRVSFPTATTVTVTGLPFSGANNYVCSAQDVTTAAGVINATTYTSGSSVTFTETNGTNTDAMRYRCDGF